MRCGSWLPSRLPGLCSEVFISRLRDNYTQWGGRDVGARRRSGEREATPARASGLMVGGRRRRGQGGRERWRYGGKEEWVAVVEGMVGPH